MSDAPMDPPGSAHRGIAVGEEVLRQIIGWDLQAAFGCQIVSLKTDAGLECYAISPDKAAAMLDELGQQLDRHIRRAMAGDLGGLH